MSDLPRLLYQGSDSRSTPENITVISANEGVKRLIVALFHFSDQKKIRIHRILLSRLMKFKTFFPSNRYNSADGRKDRQKGKKSEISDLRFCTPLRERKTGERTGGLRCASDICAATAGWSCIRLLRHFPKSIRKWIFILSAAPHEELYDLLRDGKADLVLSDQRRAFIQTCMSITS